MTASVDQVTVDENSAFFANNDASSYNTRYLKSIRNKERFQELHFFQCNVELIDELFPKQAQKGTLDPPAPYRASAALLNQWRELSQEEQAAAVEKERQEQGGEAKVENELKRGLVADAGLVNAAAPPPAAKIPKTSAGVTITVPERWDPAADDLDVDFCKDRSCRGLTLAFFKQNYPIEQSKLQAFGSLVGDAMHHKASAYKTDQCWPFASDPRVVGAIIDQAQGDAGKSVAVLKWVFVQNGDTPATNRDKLYSVQLHHARCDRNSPITPCIHCKEHAIDVLNLCSERTG